MFDASGDRLSEEQRKEPAMKKRKVTVFGSSNTDMVVNVRDLPAPGETVLGGRFLQAPGGKGANQAVAAARAGAEVSFVARVGADLLGDAALENFRRDGLRCEYVFRDPEQPSGVALILVDGRGENLIAVAPGANARLSPDDVEKAREAVEWADVVLLQLEIPLETAWHIIQVAADLEKTVILNPAPAPVEPIPPAVLGCVSILVPNESELALLTGRAVVTEEEQASGCAALLDTGIEAVVLTRGKEGALIVDGAGPRTVPAFSVDPVDTVGAGDCFSACLAVGIAEGLDLDEAGRFAAAGAALSVTREGAQPSMPTRTEIGEFLNKQ
jgi:ribokinase